MRLWIAPGLNPIDIKSFLDASIHKILQFADNHAIIIEDCGAYIRKDKYAVCFCAQRRKELQLFVVPLSGKIGDGETFDELISSVSPPPLEYEWKDIEATELPQQVNPQDFFNGFVGEEVTQ